MGRSVSVASKERAASKAAFAARSTLSPVIVFMETPPPEIRSEEWDPKGITQKRRIGKREPLPSEGEGGGREGGPFDSRSRSAILAAMLEVSDLWKSYQIGDSRIEVLMGLDLLVPRGEFVSVVGASGTGKSTLLHLLGGLDAPDEGEIILWPLARGG